MQDFIQFTARDPQDLGSPDEIVSDVSSITFGILKDTQALGDRQALLDAGRRVNMFHLDEDVIGGLEKLAESLN